MSKDNTESAARTSLSEQVLVESEIYGVLKERGVLLVEDEEDHRALVSRHLQRAVPGISVTCAGTLSEALQLVNSQPPALILSDLGLPDASGLEAVGGLCTTAQAAPVVVLTSLDDEATAVGALRMGAQDYLVKDEISPRMLRRTLRYALERHRAQQEIRSLAHYDPLTGLANRRLFEEHLRRAVKQSERRAGAIGLIFVDIDDFKGVNDSLGHAGGDAVLKEVANRLRHSVRGADVVARMGGDEFAILLEGVVGARESEKVTQRIIEAVRPPIRAGDHDVRVTASGGLAILREGETAERLLERADRAMYTVKQGSKDNAHFGHLAVLLQQWRRAC